MCFSAEASFTTAIILGATGGAAIKDTYSPSQFLIAAIPILFALQQFSEGFIWLHLTQKIGSDNLFLNAQRSFLTFAFLIWPIWIPLSFALAEPIAWRRFLLFVNLCFGITLSLINLSYALKEEISVQIIHHSLHYMGQVPK